MKVTYGEVILMREALQKLGTLKIPVSSSLKIAKLANKVNKEFQDIDLVRVNLVKQHGVADDKGNFSVELATPEEQAKFWAEYVEALGNKVNIDSDPIKLPENLEVEPATLVPLERFLEVG